MPQPKKHHPIFQVISLLLLAASASAFADYQLPVLELFATFRVQMLIVTICLGVVWIAFRAWRAALLVTVAIGLNAVAVFPYLPFDRADSNGRADVTLLLFNADKHVLPWVGIEPIETMLRDDEPDVAVLLEVGVAEAGELVEVFSAEFPHHHVYHDADHDGVVILSQLPLTQKQVLQLGPGRSIPAAQVNLSETESFTLIAPHPTNPLVSQSERNDQLAAIAAFVTEFEGALVLAGDLNVTMWSGWYRLVEGETLTNVRRGQGVIPTWQTPIPGLKLPIDHILYSGPFQLNQVRVASATYSDHLPLVAALNYR